MHPFAQLASLLTISDPLDFPTNGGRSFFN